MKWAAFDLSLSRQTPSALLPLSQAYPGLLQFLAVLFPSCREASYFVIIVAGQNSHLGAPRYQRHHSVSIGGYHSPQQAFDTALITSPATLKPTSSILAAHSLFFSISLRTIFFKVFFDEVSLYQGTCLQSVT